VQRGSGTCTLRTSQAAPPQRPANTNFLEVFSCVYVRTQCADTSGMHVVITTQVRCKPNVFPETHAGYPPSPHVAWKLAHITVAYGLPDSGTTHPHLLPVLRIEVQLFCKPTATGTQVRDTFIT
jgi:hypothetical protein